MSAFRKLEIIHDSSLKMSIGTYHSTSQVLLPNIYNLTGVHPLNTRKLKLSLNQKLRFAKYYFNT
jgi:hypothetical protein